MRNDFGGSIIVRTSITTILPHFTGGLTFKYHPYNFMFQLMISILLSQSIPSPLIHLSLFLSELGVMLFVLLLFGDDVLENSIFIYICMAIIFFYSLNKISLDNKMWGYFEKNWNANIQIKSLKGFLENNMLSSIIIFSLPDEFFGEEKLKSNNLKIEMFNSNSKKLARDLLREDEDEKSDSQICLKTFGNLFVRTDKNVTLRKEMKEYAKILCKEEASFNQEHIAQEMALSFICRLKNARTTSQWNIGEPQVSNQLYKVVLSPMMLENKKGIILQLEDITFLKSLEEERRVSQTRQTTIQ